MHLETGSQASRNAAAQHKEPTHTPLKYTPQQILPSQIGPHPLVQDWARSERSQPSGKLGLMWWARLLHLTSCQTQNPASSSVPKVLYIRVYTCHCLCLFSATPTWKIMSLGRNRKKQHHSTVCGSMRLGPWPWSFCLWWGNPNFRKRTS